jgi:hypothetical protein
MYKMRSTFGGA